MKNRIIPVLLALIICAIFSASLAEISEDSGFEGLLMERIEHGKTIFSLQAARAKIANKRVGFFELGIAKVILLEDVDFTFYANDSGPKRQHFKHAVYDPSAYRLIDSKGKTIFCFEKIKT